MTDTIPDDAWIPPVAKRALNLLSDQITELEDRNRDLAGAIRVLSKAIEDIQEVAEENTDLDAHGYNSIYHICTTGGVKTAMTVIGS